MIIQSSQLALSSQHQSIQSETVKEDLRYWHNGRTKEDAEQAVGKLKLKSDRVSIDFHREQFELTSSAMTAEQTKKVEPADEGEDIQQDWKLMLLRRLVESLTGKKIELTSASDFQQNNEQPRQTEAPAAAPEDAGQNSLGWGLEYNYQRSYQESERTEFMAQGKVLTADGKEINFNVGLSMSREFISQESINLRAGDALKDPLVLNFSGTAAQLEATDLHFDLDLDGTPDQLQFVAPGSGFLALDKNQDGQINDGSELFGPNSGDGFAELAAYDDDGNNWIDENDAIFDRLRIWERDSAGNFSLLALGQRGVGAIYLGRVDTPFAVKDEQNQLQGQIRSTGLFLQENGLAGTVQQLDLVV